MSFALHYELWNPSGLARRRVAHSERIVGAMNFESDRHTMRTPPGNNVK
jgi:hypothetical protein